MDLTVLKTELLNDPSALGYAALLALGSTQALADALNLVRDSINIDRQLIQSYEVVNAIVPADWTTLTAAERQRVELIIGAGQVDVKNTNVRSQFLQAFGVGTATRAALATLQSRKGSRAEQLFGALVVVTSNDVAAALAE